MAIAENGAFAEKICEMKAVGKGGRKVVVEAGTK
jgi:hypothetical protein